MLWGPLPLLESLATLGSAFPGPLTAREGSAGFQERDLCKVLGASLASVVAEEPCAVMERLLFGGGSCSCPWSNTPGDGLSKNLHDKWPESYFFIQDQPPDYWISRHPIRYLTFRLGPGFVVCVLAGWTLVSYGNHVLLPCVLIVVTHWALSSGRRLFQITRKQGGWCVSLPLSLHAVLLPTLTIFSAVGAMAGHRLADLAGKDDVLLQIILTAMFLVVTRRWKHYIGEGQMSEEDILFAGGPGMGCPVGVRPGERAQVTMGGDLFGC
jgi:hypothetical protein